MKWDMGWMHDALAYLTPAVPPLSALFLKSGGRAE